MQQRGVQMGYFLAISLLLSALFYFFASNWPALDRWGKIGISTAVLALFYLFSYAGSYVLKRHSFISNWLLVAGGLAFGLSVALLGQIYNSHADSYMLFVVWFIPNILFAILTRYQPFYVISYVLAHLAICFFLQPSVIRVTHEEEWWFMVFWLIALCNIALLWLTATGKIQSRAIYYLSFAVFQVSLFGSSFVDVYGPFPEVLYLLVGAGLFVTFLKWLPNRGLLIATSSFLAVFLIVQFFWYMLQYYSEGFFLIALLVAAALVWGAVAGIKWLRQGSSQESTWVRFFQEAFTVLVTTIAASIGAISLAGLLFLIFEDDTVVHFLFFLSLIGFIAPVMFFSGMNSTVRYTLLTMGYILGASSALFLEGYYWILFLGVLVFAWIAVSSIPARLLTQLAFLLVLFFQLHEFDVSDELILLVFIVFQLVMYFLPQLPVVLQNSSLVYALLAFLMLTESNSYGITMNVTINVLFFGFSTYMLYRTLQAGRRVDFGIVLGFWFAFMLMKYYDLLWSLLHKSLSLLLLSIVFFGVSYWLDRRSREEWALPQPPIFSQKRKNVFLGAIILLQFAIIGYQVWNSESILAKGATVKLELAPVDPRSLLQGDYVRLAYTISSLPHEEFSAGKKIRVVLRKQENGLYDYSGYYEQNGVWNKSYTAQPSDVIINGNTLGYERVEYGIESFFVPEGTGLEIERSAKYAIVKVGAKGDALLESLSPQ
ncbi:GDYXXLXY domain-containing protein [Brevibacillus sp. NRS-1366]|uniref:GDYXXLXY domain-containing protein n=1 Tax=Brevibacillus sp. NRS-1366 TaxID=3233899 RepID=UPI003D210E50